MSLRKVVGLIVSGALAGALLAVVVPSKTLAASQGCICNDWGSGSYACTMDQTKCGTGGDICQVTCGAE
ncbi:MAG: hypothetical protein HOP28_02075 [Gemmatimonadales bacterium]|nr:hypothetical protein [Gemmatimonadales bacterium]